MFFGSRFTRARLKDLRTQERIIKIFSGFDNFRNSKVIHAASIAPYYRSSEMGDDTSILNMRHPSAPLNPTQNWALYFLRCMADCVIVPEKDIRENHEMFRNSPEDFGLKREIYDPSDKKKNFSCEIYITKPKYNARMMVENPLFAYDCPHKKYIYGKTGKIRKYKNFLKTKFIHNYPILKQQDQFMKKTEFLEDDKPSIQNLVKYLQEEKKMGLILVENDLESLHKMYAETDPAVNIFDTLFISQYMNPEIRSFPEGFVNPTKFSFQELFRNYKCQFQSKGIPDPSSSYAEWIFMLFHKLPHSKLSYEEAMLVDPEQLKREEKKEAQKEMAEKRQNIGKKPWFAEKYSDKLKD
ncbi:unnamed protein product [Moneuplotes crassus]|uniref:Uncharacterized protein n=1 Tax=Euplotes crassus TaxID=5936 RepID=A0AAD1XH67_EUPCR|nr:unnamed protein product [Moneuplotes crassus]